MTPQELKNSILQLAIQGKLVEQRPEEGTAQELFEQIQAEKQRLIKAGKLKKEKPLPEITEDEKPFEIPESWMWVRLESLCNIINGFTPSRSNPDFWNGDIPWFTIDDVREQGRFISYTKQHITSKAIAKGTQRIVPPNTVLLCCTASVGEYAYTKISLTTNQQFNALVIRDENVSLLWSMYLYLFVQTLKPQIIAWAGRTTFNFLSVSKLKAFLVPLPPLAEQKRIVAKIEELLPYIDRYEQAWSKLEQFNSRFPEDMKKALLQYAIQGKLVEQRPEEGTGEELFAQIQAEKQRLIQTGKIKKEKPLPEITEDEKPFEIPESWKWMRLGSILHYIDTGKSFKCDEVPPTHDKCGIIKVSAVTWGNFKEEESKTCYSESLWVDEYAIHKNDFLICRANTADLVGGCVIVEEISKRLMLSDKVLRLHFSEKAYPLFLLWAVRTPLVRNQFSIAATGTSESMKNISQDTLKNITIPLPPLAEQKRIVEKLKQLLPLCERLK